jgi:hypothetical protein
MIIIEGPDGVGKTTAARKLCQMGGLTYNRMGPPAPDMDHVSWYLNRIEPTALWDRFHLGEEAYGHLGFSRRGAWIERVRVRHELEQVRACVILMYASDPASLRSHPGKELYTEIQIRAVNRRYQEIADTTTWWTIRHDVSKSGFPDDVTLQDWITTWKAAGRE